MRYLSCAETAKLVRAALKAAFPGTKFAVRSKTYSGGASISVYWTDGPTEKDVEAVTWRYRGASFDPMVDLKSYHSTVISTDDGAEEVHMGADYIFGRRELSAGFLASLEAAAEYNMGATTCPYCRCGFERGWTIPDVDLNRVRAYGCSPEHAALGAADKVSA